MELIIAQSINNFSKFDKYLSKKVDILVFDQRVMVALDKKNINYLGVEDFYNADDYFMDVSIYRDHSLNLLSELDKFTMLDANFKYAFTGNEHYFLTLFDDLFYLEKLIQIIQKKYSKIYLFSYEKPKVLKFDNLTFSNLNSYKVNGTISFPDERNVNRKIQLIYNYLDIIFIKDDKDQKTNLSLKLKLKKNFNKYIYYFNKWKYFQKFKINNPSKFKHIKICVIQFGYELAALKKYLPKYQYYNPSTELRKIIENEKPMGLKDISSNNTLKHFIDKYFVILGNYFLLIIRSYNDEIVARIFSFQDKLNISIKKDKPNLMLFGIGTRDIYDTICCSIANKSHIPTIIFQHGGTHLFFFNPYDKSLEFNDIVKKTLIVKSKIDIKRLNNSMTNVLCMGSIQQFEISNYRKTYTPRKDIIFCLGPDTNLSFRQLLNFYSIKKKHLQSLDIINTTEELLLDIDIKLHPTGEDVSYKAFSNIIKNNNFKRISLLYGDIFENLSNNYRLVIIDYLGSAIIKHLLCLNVPIIIYDRDFNKIRIKDSIREEIRNRCYIVNNKYDLKLILQKFKMGQLQSKWSREMIDKYVYPINDGNPGKNISKYIETLI